jgi:L-ascorbate metabolism protein UlaG (beta-lactamase superfamily)
MEPTHNNAADAVRGFIDSGGRYLIPMHYGTFDLSDEPPSEPLRQLMQEAERNGIADKVRPLAINQSIVIE